MLRPLMTVLFAWDASSFTCIFTNVLILRTCKNASLFLCRLLHKHVYNYKGVSCGPTRESKQACRKKAVGKIIRGVLMAS